MHICVAQEDPLETGMTAHSSILARRIPWTEEPGGLQSMGSQSRTRLSDGDFHVCEGAQQQWERVLLGLPQPCGPDGSISLAHTAQCATVSMHVSRPPLLCCPAWLMVVA